MDWVDPKVAVRKAVLAIVCGDADSLAAAVSSAPIDGEVARKIGIQAWRSDLANNKVGVRMHDGGLLSATYVGIMRAQDRAGSLDVADNATTLMCNICVHLDDPRVLDVLIDWDPNFRMGPSTGGASVESTAEFFMHSGSTKCAQRMLERKDELVMSVRNSFLKEHARARLKRNAERILHRNMHKGDETTEAALEDLIEGGGEVKVVHMHGAVFTVGLALIGKSELLVNLSALKNADMKTAWVCERVGLLASKAMCGDPIESEADAHLSPVHPLWPFAEATKHLRPPRVAPYVVARM